MCMPHGSAQIVSGGFERKDKTKKHVPFNEKLMKADPDFIDERRQENATESSSSLIQTVLSLFKS